MRLLSSRSLQYHKPHSHCTSHPFETKTKSCRNSFSYSSFTEQRKCFNHAVSKSVETGKWHKLRQSPSLAENSLNFFPKPNAAPATNGSSRVLQESKMLQTRSWDGCSMSRQDSLYFPPLAIQPQRHNLCLLVVQPEGPKQDIKFTSRTDLLLLQLSWWNVSTDSEFMTDVWKNLLPLWGISARTTREVWRRESVLSELRFCYWLQWMGGYMQIMYLVEKEAVSYSL